MTHVVVDWAGRSAEQLVPIDSLLPADSPRLAGESVEHARVLADSDAVLPPIVVHRSTMRVIDGMHRLRAAALRGQREVLVRFHEGDDDEAFIVAVETNIAHGLPLSRADRTAAAVRILTMRPQWSDRRIAGVTGLAASTVGSIRRRSANLGDSGDRLGQDGKVHPRDRTTGRLRAAEFIKENPAASIRAVARAAGVSPATAMDVRNRLRQGRSPLPRESPGPGKYAAQHDHTARKARLVDAEAVLTSLRKDPTLRFADRGRVLLRWLDTHTVGLEQWKQHAHHVPPHSVHAIVKLARQNSAAWLEFAQYLEAGRLRTQHATRNRDAGALEP
jgi:transposase-like protein